MHSILKFYPDCEMFVEFLWTCRCRFLWGGIRGQHGNHNLPDQTGRFGKYISRWHHLLGESCFAFVHAFILALMHCWVLLLFRSEVVTYWCLFCRFWAKVNWWNINDSGTIVKGRYPWWLKSPKNCCRRSASWLTATLVLISWSQTLCGSM